MPVIRARAKARLVAASLAASVTAVPTTATAAVLAAPFTRAATITAAGPALTHSADARDWAADVAMAHRHLDFALEGDGPCTRVVPCLEWTRMLECRGTTFLVTRLNTGARTQILRAKAARALGCDDAALALIASTQAHDGGIQSWMYGHAGAVLQALDETPISLDGRDKFSIVTGWLVPQQAIDWYNSQRAPASGGGNQSGHPRMDRPDRG